MAQTTKRLSIGGNPALLADIRNPQHPFVKGVFIICHKYTVHASAETGDNFPTGNGLDIEVDGAQTILFAIAKTPSNTLLSITESALSGTGRQGIKVATGTSATDVEVLIVAKV